MRAALDECTANIENLNQTHDRTKKELITLEFQYCLARQEANMCSMSADDFRLRLEWQMEEIARVNAEKEAALAANLAYSKDRTLLRKELDHLADLKTENQKLKQVNRSHEKRQKELDRQLEEARKCLDKAEYSLQSVPGLIQKFCTRVLVPTGKKENGRDGSDKEKEGPGTTKGQSQSGHFY